MVRVRNLFRLRLEAPEGFQNQLFTYLDAGDGQEDTRLAVLAEWHDRTVKAILEPILRDLAGAEGETRTPASAFVEDFVRAMDAGCAHLPDDVVRRFEVGIVLVSGRSLYVLSSAGLQPYFSLGGPPQLLQSTLRVRVKDLPWTAEVAAGRIGSRLSLGRVFFEDEDRAMLWLGSSPQLVEALPALPRPAEAASGGARIVLLKDPATEDEIVQPASTWPEEHREPGRDRVRMSYAVLALVVAVFALALFGMSRWKRMAEADSAGGAADLLAQEVDSSLEPGRVAGEALDAEVAAGETVEMEVASVPPAEQRGDSDRPLQVLWSKRHTDWVTSSPRWVQGQVVYGCRDGRVYAVDASGAPLWEYDSGGGIGATPEVDGTRVYCGNYAGRAFALRALDGVELWAHDLGARIVASAAVGKNLVFFQTYAGDVAALEQKSGRLAWKKHLGGQLRARALVTKQDVLVVSGSGELLCLEQKTGEPQWSVALGARVIANPLRVGDLVLLGSHDGQVHAVRLEDGGVAWRVRTSGAVDSSPATQDGKRVFVGTGDGHLYAIDANSGRIAWRFRTKGAILSTPGVEQDHVYVTAYDRNTYVLDAETGELVGKTGLKAAIYSSPLVHEGRVYFGSNDGTFYCLSAAR